MFLWITRPAIAPKAIMLVFALLCLVLAIEIIAVASGRHPHPWLLVEALPVPCFLAAIWSVRRAVILIGRGVALHALVSPLFQRVGAALFLGGLARVFGAPILLRLLRDEGAIARYDPSAITVGVVGLALMIAARLVAEAEAMRAELDEIV